MIEKEVNLQNKAVKKAVLIEDVVAKMVPTLGRMKAVKRERKNLTCHLSLRFHCGRKRMSRKPLTTVTPQGS